MKKSILKGFDLKSEITLRWLLYILTFLWWLKWGVIPTNDTSGYWDMAPYRSPGYPIFIKITTLFGLIHNHIPTLLIALFLQLFAIHKLVDLLKKHFGLSKFSIMAVTSILILPDFILSIANGDMSECIAYPLFLIALGLLLKSAFDKNQKAAISYFAVVALLILIRSQFLFVYGVSFLLIIFLVWHSQKKIASIFRLLGLFIISVAIVPFVDRTYHLVANGSFSPTQFTGLQLIVPALYNMQPKDTLLFNDPVERGLIDTVRNAYKNSELYNCKLISGEVSENMVFRFDHLYILLQFRTTKAYLANIIKKKGMKPGNMDYWSEIDKISTDVALKLIKAHPKEYLTLYFNLFKSGMGFMQILAPFLLLLLLSISGFLVYGNKLSIMLLISCFLMIFNIGLVSILEMGNARYLFYTSYLLFAIGYMMIAKGIEEGHKIKAFKQ